MNFKPKRFTADAKRKGTVVKLPEEKGLFFVSKFEFALNGGESFFGSLLTLLYTYDLKWH